MERLGVAGAGGARSDFKRPTMAQLAPFLQSSPNNTNEIRDAGELKVQGKRGRVGGGDSACCFRVRVGALPLWGSLAAAFLVCASNTLNWEPFAD